MSNSVENNNKFNFSSRKLSLSLLVIIVIIGTSFFIYQKILQNRHDENQLSSLSDGNNVTPDGNSLFGELIDKKEISSEMLGKSLFPDQGKVMEHNNEMIFVYSLNNSERSFFEKIENKGNYPLDKYKVVTLSEQDSIKYVTGYFDSWEDIEGTLDKYLVIRYPPSFDIVKFRISFQESNLFSSEISFLFYEETNKLDKNSIFVIEPYDSQYNDFISLTYERVKEDFKNGDYVVVLPLFDPPEYNKKDENGNYLGSHVYIRR